MRHKTTPKITRLATAKTIPVLDIEFSPIQIGELLAEIGARISSKSRTYLAFANAEYVLNLADSPLLHIYLKRADYVLPDASSIVWASRKLSKLPENRLQNRVTGTDFQYALMEWCAKNSKKLYVLGGSAENNKKGLENARKLYPKLKIDGRDGYFDPADSMRVIKKINQSRADVLMVCFGNPRQEEWLMTYADQLKVCVQFGNGGAIDFLAGTAVRAPLWMQKAGFEWLWRLFQDLTWRGFSKRFRRQTRLLLFVWMVWLQSIDNNLVKK